MLAHDELHPQRPSNLDLLLGELEDGCTHAYGEVDEGALYISVGTGDLALAFEQVQVARAQAQRCAGRHVEARVRQPAEDRRRDRHGGAGT